MTNLTRWQIFDLMNRPKPFWLAGIDLSEVSLKGADLSGSNFIGGESLQD